MLHQLVITTRSISYEQVLYNQLVHSLPFAIFFINWLISDVIMHKRHFFRCSTLPATAYLLFNYAYVRSTGRQLYPFYDWNNNFDIAIQSAAITVLFVSFIYIVEAELTQRVKKGFVQRTKLIDQE